MTNDTSKKQSGWNKFFKGNERGGAWIHTHPELERAIVENHYGFSYAGQYYTTLRAAKRAALKVKRNAAEKERLTTAYSSLNDSVCQTLGKALGYPWYKDDLKNFPDATEENGVCVGDHVAESIASEAASRIKAQAKEIKELQETLKYYRQRGTVECRKCQGQGTKEGTNCPECKGSGRLP